MKTHVIHAVEPLEGRRLLSGTPLFTQTNLVSDGAVTAARTDASLLNPWGMVITKNEVWVSDNGSGVAEIFDKAGGTLLSNVTIPVLADVTDPSAPDGVVFNKSKAFNVTANGVTGPSIYVFATEDGTIAGWSPTVDATHAVIAVDNSPSGAVYKGLASAGSGRHALLFAANFHMGKVDVFDSNFQPVSTVGGFADPNLPAGYAPFNVQNIGGKLYVTYAVQDAQAHDDVPGAGNGVVDVFDTKGRLKRRFATGGTLNSPWGVVAVSKSRFGGDILVGNFRDGRINVFSSKGVVKGQLLGADSQPITIPLLWSMASSDKNTLLFTAGPNDEADGLFGSLTRMGTTSSNSGGGGGGFHY